ncbi:unnamed protein product [Symbiodinium natans]|uniref:Uncharacterized protein n=1 Tax=Symbiodinium natans TaxID=878477 RepID=A0A812S7G4_9DINO|nr:unnamed protein product [Symbiodinium natans]
MSVHAPGDAGLELTSLGASAPATQSFLQPTSSRDSRLARRRAVTKADINRDLQRLEEEHVWYRQVQMALAGYTLVRIVANLVANLYADSDEHQPSHPAFHAIFRPIVTGLGMYVFLCKKDLFRQGKPLHTWSFRTACCLALPLDGRLVKVLAPRFVANGMITLWQVLCNVLSVYMTTLKIRAVGWRATANLCNLLTATGIGALALFSVRYASKPCRLHPFDEIPSRVIKLAMFNCFCTTFATLALQVWSLCCAASTAVMQAQGETTIMSTAYILYANSVLVILGPALSFAGLFARTNLTLVTLDVIFQVCNVLFLSGMIGPVQWDLETLRSLAELSGYGLASKRIAFPGHISENAPDCIVSFPGKYGDRWDHAVRNVTESGAFSLACVFFTDTESGLGQHATNPVTGECWCHEIYGPMSAPAYVRLVDMMDCNATTLAFEMEDAKAMGKLLRVRHGETDMEWKASGLMFGRRTWTEPQHFGRPCTSSTSRAP